MNAHEPLGAPVEEAHHTSLPKRVRAWFIRYERPLAVTALVSGFIADSLFLTRIDLYFENLVFFSYLAVAGLGIAMTNLAEGGILHGRLGGWLKVWAPLAVQFAFGALFSGFLIFYSQSASLEASWPFLFIVTVLFIGNEFFRRQYIRLSFQVSIFFFALFSYAIFFIPILIGAMGAGVFLLSGATSVAFLIAFLSLLSRFIPARVRESRRLFLVSIAGIFVLINALYFMNVIPPIPLSLKEAEVCHDVVRRDAGEYLIRCEPKKWYAFVPVRPVYHVIHGKPVYLFSSVFAPTDLNTHIVHEWRYYHAERRRWVTVGRVSFPITGGRDGGYRGYSIKTNVFPGLWRVDIETPRGQRIGHVTFRLEHSDLPPPLKTVIR